MKQKAARREAEHYLWHLRPEWRERFDHEHWWNGKEDKVPIEAVMWEIMRRHPNAARVHQRWNSDDEMNELQFQVGRDGLRSWPKLTAQQQGDFKKRLWELSPSHHGFAAPPVTVLNDFRPFDKHIRKLKSKKDNERLSEFKMRLERRLWRNMLSFHNKGQIIVAIDIGGNADRVARGVKEAVQKLRGAAKLNAIGKSRTFQRLNVIAEFENEELSRKLSKTNRNADLFTRYRRTIDCFPLLVF
jgi:hypothetical protein